MSRQLASTARQDVANFFQMVELRAANARQHIQRRPLGDDLPLLEKKKVSANGDRLGRAVGHVQDGDLPRPEPCAGVR